MVRPVSSLGASSRFTPMKALQGSILGSGFWYVRTLGVFWGWPKLLFLMRLAENLQEKLECIGLGEHVRCRGGQLLRFRGAVLRLHRYEQRYGAEVHRVQYGSVWPLDSLHFHLPFRILLSSW